MTATASMCSRCWYNFNKVVDAPGYWRFEAYLDGQKVLEEQLKVLAGE